MSNCPICGSGRMLEGPAYSPEETTCLDCGSQFNREVRRMPEPEEVKEQLTETVPFPTGGFSTPQEAAAHLKKLQEQAMKIGKSPIISKQNKTSKKKLPTMPKETETSYPPDLVFMALNCYQRKGETWQQVLVTAKEEKKLRNENVLIFAHAHNFGQECTHLCRELTEQ